MSTYKTSKLVIPRNWNGALIVGDCPYSDSSVASPFMHSHLGTLVQLQAKANWDIASRPAYANVLDFFPKNAKFASVPESVLTNQRADLVAIIDELKPRLLLGLGRQTAPYIKHGFGGDLDEERGAPFATPYGTGLLSYHPREIFRQYEYNVVAVNDFIKAWRYLRDGWTEQKWFINYQPSFKEALELLYKFLESRSPLSVDIETNYHLGITCIGLAYNNTSALVIPFVTPDGPYWKPHEERAIWKVLCRVLELCPLIGQNAVHFDHYILARGYKINANFVADTMFAQWEVYCEMQKSLAFINSLYLDNPYWKSVLKEARTGKVHHSQEWLYCGKDCIVTLQGANKLRHELSELPPGSYSHYKFNIRVSRVCQYMSIRGVEFDTKKRDERVKQLETEAHEMQLHLDTLAGKHIYVTSPTKMKRWLYEELKLPIHYNKKTTDEGDVEYRETQDYLTLLLLAREFPNIPALSVAGKLRKLRKRISSLSLVVPRPGTNIVGWTFNAVGTETGRFAGYKPPDGWGVQPQNVYSGDKDLFLPGDGNFWCKSDLEGADSWTVAAMLSALGDNRMMDDLLHGIKPAQALTIASLFGEHLITASWSELKALLPSFKTAMKEQEKVRGKKRTDYDAYKAVSHGTNYCMGPKTTCDNIFKKSDGELYVSLETCRDKQFLYEKRYPGLAKLKERMASLLSTHGYLDAYSGNRRIFFGRRDNNTVREMISQLPQAHTTYVTNLLFDRLFHWKGNRMGNGRELVVKPVNQVHDEACKVFARSDLDRAREIFRVCSVNRITCWGVDFTIPFESTYGESWGECDEVLV